MSPQEAYDEFVKLRFCDTDGRPQCPRCKCDAVNTYKTRRIFKCKLCQSQFSATTDTIFADHKLPFEKILLAISRFIGPAKGVNAEDLADLLVVTYKTAFVLAHKLRSLVEADAATIMLDGVVEIDGAEIGGHVRPPNVKKKEGDHRKWPYRHKDRKQSAIVIRQRGGRILTAAAKNESAGVPAIRSHLKKGTIVHADSAACWNVLEASFHMERINHKESYWTPEASTNGAESFFSTMRRASFGIHHHISGRYLHLYLAFLAWRSTNRAESKRSRVGALCGLLGKHNPSEMRGYWQRSQRGGAA